MPRKLMPTLPFDDAEDEILFTIAALKADPDAQDLAPMTDGWLALVDAARAKDRAARQKEMEADAARVVANNRLDRACEKFGDELFLAVDKDRRSARWTQFFSMAVSKFVRQRLDVQVQRVRGWLASADAVLDKHRDGLDTWSRACGDALVQRRSAAMVRGEARVAREEIADDLTRERDGLHDALSSTARGLGLPRDWPDQFFRSQSRAGGDGEEAPAPAPAPGGSPPTG